MRNLKLQSKKFRISYGKFCLTIIYEVRAKEMIERKKMDVVRLFQT